MEIILEKIYEKRKLIERLLTVFAVLALSLSVAVTFQGSFTFFAVARGTSMHPVFANNDLMLFVPQQVMTRFREPKVGDIIVFRAPAVPPVWAHRIIEEEEPGVFRTQGDNNPRPDSFVVPEKDILGIVPQWGNYALSFPGLGGLMQKWQSDPIFHWGIPILMLVLLAALPSGNRARIRRRISSRGWLLKRLAIAVGCGLALLVITIYPFLSKSGYTAVAYGVAEGEGIAFGGSAPINLGIIKQGDIRTEEYTMANGSIIPMVAVMQVVNDPLNEVRTSPSISVLPPGNTATIDVEVEAKEIGKWRQVPLAVTMTPYLMPSSWVAKLSRIHPMVPNIMISGVLSLLFGLLIFIIIGRRRRTKPVHTRRRQRFPAKAVAGWTSVGSLFALGFLLPVLLASTALTISGPAVVSVVTAPLESSTIAWRPGEAEVEIVSGTSQLVGLFQIENSYPLGLWIEVGVTCNDGNILADWDASRWLEPYASEGWQGTLDAGSLEPGVYLVEFLVRAYTEEGSLVAEWDAPGPVVMVTAPPEPEPEP